MEPDEPLSETVAGMLGQLFRWLPAMLTVLFVALVPTTHLYAGIKGHLPARTLAQMTTETRRAYDAWAWMDAHRSLGLAYSVLLIAVSFYFGRARRKLWVGVLLVMLLLPALWYWNEVAWLGGKLLGS